MIKQLAFAALLACASFAPVEAKNIAVPTKNPAVTMWLPDDWKVSDINYGISAVSPDGGVFFSIEFTSMSRIEKMAGETDRWMRDNKIKIKGESKQEIEVGGLKGTMHVYEATDKNGETQVAITFFPISGNRVIMTTVWGSEEEQKDNEAALKRMLESFKSID